MPITDQTNRMTYMKNMLEVSSNINLMYTILDQMTITENGRQDLKTFKGDKLLEEMLKKTPDGQTLSQKVEVQLDEKDFTITIKKSETGDATITLSRDLDENQSTPGYTATFSATIQEGKAICTPIIDGINIKTGLNDPGNPEFFMSRFGPNYQQAFAPKGLIPTEKPTPFTMRPILALSLLKYVEHKGAQLTSTDMKNTCALMDLGPALGKTTIQVAIAQATVLSGKKVCMVVPHSGLVEAMKKDSTVHPITQNSISTDITNLSADDKNCFIITVSQLEDLLIRKKLYDKKTLSAEESIKATLKDLNALEPSELEAYNEIVGNIMIDEAHELEENQEYDIKSRFDITQEEDIKTAKDLIAEKGLNEYAITMDRPSMLLEMKKCGGTFLSGSCIQGINPNSNLYLNPIITALMKHAIEWKLLRDADLEHVYSEKDPHIDALLSRMFDLTPIQETDKDYHAENTYLSTSSGKSFIYMDENTITQNSSEIQKTCQLLNKTSFEEIKALDENLSAQIQKHIEVSAEKIFRHQLKKAEALFLELTKTVSDLDKHYEQYRHKTNDSIVDEKKLKDKISELHKKLEEEKNTQKEFLEKNLTAEYGNKYYKYFEEKFLSSIEINYDPTNNKITEAQQQKSTTSFSEVFSEVQKKKNKDTNKITERAITGMALSILTGQNLKGFDTYVSRDLAKKPLLTGKDIIKPIRPEELSEVLPEILNQGDYKNLPEPQKTPYLNILKNEILRIQQLSDEDLKILKLMDLTRINESDRNRLQLNEFEVLKKGLSAKEVTEALARNALGLSTTLCASPKFAAGISDKSVLSVFIAIESEKSDFTQPSTLAQAIGRAFRSDNLRALVKFVLGKSVYQKDNTTSLSSGTVLIKRKESHQNTWELILEQIHIGLDNIMDNPKEYFKKQANSQDQSNSSPVPLSEEYTYDKNIVEELNKAYDSLFEALGPTVKKTVSIEQMSYNIIELEKKLSINLILQKIQGTPLPQNLVEQTNPTTLPPITPRESSKRVSRRSSVFNIFKGPDLPINSYPMLMLNEKRNQCIKDFSGIAQTIASTIWESLRSQSEDTSVIPVGYQQYIKSSRPSTAETASILSVSETIDTYEEKLKSAENLSIGEINGLTSQLDNLILQEQKSAQSSSISKHSSDSAQNRSVDEPLLASDADILPLVKPIMPSHRASPPMQTQDERALLSLKEKFNNLLVTKMINAKPGSSSTA